MGDGPIANYEYKPFKSRPGKKLGFDAVGPGWKPILEALDSQMKGAIRHAVQHATVVKPEYRDEECRADASIEVFQVKEKFGGLRVYWGGEGLSSRINAELSGATAMAEAMSYKTCEDCGSAASDTRAAKSGVGVWVRTLCEDCHVKRDKEKGS